MGRFNNLNANSTTTLTTEQRNYNQIKLLCKQTEAQFAKMLGTPEKASQFGASVISAVATNKMLQQCDPVKIMQQALIAASLNLEVNLNLGLSAIIPYNSRGETLPQFQIMSRGYIQLAIRSGEYQSLNCTEVYNDEFVSFDPFENKLNYKIVPNGQRDNGNINNIIGYYAYYILNNGAKHCLYWTVEQIKKHAEKYSKSYKSEFSPWQTNFDAMAKKTLIKQLIANWGIMSTIMQRAIIVDQATGITTNNDGNITEISYEDSYEDNPKNNEKSEIYGGTFEDNKQNTAAVETELNGGEAF